MTAVLRTMTAGDLPAVMALENELFPEDAWSEQMMRGELAEQPRTRHYVVAEDPPGTIVGYAGLAAAGEQGDVQTIAVRPAHQGRGVGAALLTELLAEAGRRGCTEVFLEVRADNDRARALYERFGFERVGLRKRYYQPSGVDAVVMRRRVGGAGTRPSGFARGNAQ
ncbi:ribosomal protein S18-alanine N-acetyltransferase [Thermomonospora amylolytica]|uniref:ribosomal protein S18-alanine N-acetyltransferase n=1 Tax=Thermomonospora amylolytica TaxID=1411117 RepID=UPI001F178CBA|nr:ribosomal protein S18-alanine N-acetyltransferase [Thermomonospora amylolytica]